MSKPELSREEAIRKLNQQADALETRNTIPVKDHGGNAVNQGYALIAQLTGGVLVGLAAGFGVDAFAGTKPWGTIIGVLVGFGLSVWLTVRSARRMTENALKTYGPGQAVPFDEDDGD